MVYAFFSDVHANLPAWESVKQKLLGYAPDRIVCIGDTVGYGPFPQECWREVAGLKATILGGNHDWAAANKISKSSFSFLARAALEWTEPHLPEEVREGLAGLELVWQEGKLKAVHSSLFQPESFPYLDNRYILEENFKLMEEGGVCFVGHTHIPAVFTLRPRRIEYRRGTGKMKLQRRLKHIVNVGSVGQPRDRDPRACFCLYDSSLREVKFIRVSYDIGRVQRNIINAGLPELLALRLEKGW